MRISLCTPTRKRAERFAGMVNSARATAILPERVEVICYQDDGELRYPKMDGVKYANGPRPTNHGYTQMSGLWTRAWEHATGDIAMLCADDVEFVTPGWDERVREAFRSVPDRIVMVYTPTGNDIRPVLPFVSREWIDAAGFTPDHLQGWFADEWIWAMAADIDRAIYLEDVIIRHNQWGQDETYIEGQRARERQGGLQPMRKKFYSIGEVKKRDALVKKLRVAATSPVRCVPDPLPQWFHDSVIWSAAAREHGRRIENTLVVVHCWAGDKDMVRNALPVHLAHNGKVLVLSPEDSPVKMRVKGVECRSAGKRGYFGQVSLDRQREHLQMLLEYPQEYFLLNDADSVCLEPLIPAYLYEEKHRGTVWSNEVGEWRPHISPYPKMAMQPPYFLHRSSIERMLSVAHLPHVRAHPITPYIDWYMLALCEEAGVKHRTFPDGRSFPAWGRGEIAETQALGQEPKHEHDPDGKMRGDLDMKHHVMNAGTVFVHSVKHKEILDMLLEARAQYIAKGAPPLNTLSIEEYVHQKQEEETVRVQVASWQEGDRIQI